MPLNMVLHGRPCVELHAGVRTRHWPEALVAMLFQQGSGNLGQAVREVGRAGSNNSARDNHSHSHDDSPDGDDTGSPTFRNGVGSKRGGGTKTKRNARQQDQNKQVAVSVHIRMTPAHRCRCTRLLRPWRWGM